MTVRVTRLRCLPLPTVTTLCACIRRTAVSRTRDVARRVMTSVSPLNTRCGVAGMSPRLLPLGQVVGVDGVMRGEGLGGGGLLGCGALGEPGRAGGAGGGTVADFTAGAGVAAIGGANGVLVGRAGAWPGGGVGAMVCAGGVSVGVASGVEDGAGVAIGF